MSTKENKNNKFIEEATKIIKDPNKGNWSWLFKKKNQKELNTLIWRLVGILSNDRLTKHEKNKKINAEFKIFREELRDRKNVNRYEKNENDNESFDLDELEETEQADEKDQSKDILKKIDSYQMILPKYEFAALLNKTTPESPGVLNGFSEVGNNILYKRARIRMKWRRGKD